MHQDFPKGMQLAKALVAKFPDSLFARTEEFACAMTAADLGEVSGQELVDLAKQFKRQENDPPWEKSAYYCRLGEALMRTNRLDDAIASLQKSDELWPQNMACMTLAGLFEERIQMDEAERYWRRTTSLDQERIQYWESLSRVLSARLKSKEESEASDRVNFLEDLYRSR